MSNRERKTEASMPVQSRIDLRILAELSDYWESEGYIIDNMSRLVSWSLDVLRDLLKMNNKLPTAVSTLEDAYASLSRKGLIQKSMQKRMDRKLVYARSLENVRLDGWEVNRDSEFYQTLHKKNQVQPYPGGGVSDEEYKRVTGMTREEARRQLGGGGADMREVDRKLEEQKANMEFDKNGVYLGQKKKKIGGGITINVEDNQRRALAEDERIRNLDMMPPAGPTAKDD